MPNKGELLSSCIRLPSLVFPCHPLLLPVFFVFINGLLSRVLLSLSLTKDYGGCGSVWRAKAFLRAQGTYARSRKSVSNDELFEPVMFSLNKVCHTARLRL